VLWSLAESLEMKAQLAKNAPIISTIGAALAMVRDVVERTIVNPSEEDILSIRAEAEHLAIESGANPANCGGERGDRRFSQPCAGHRHGYHRTGT